MKYYSVKKGRKPGIYKTWEACQTQVVGFQGALYKSFSTFEQAEAYLVSGNEKKASFNQENLASKDVGVAYSDGSFLKTNQTYSYGAVILWNTKEFHFSRRYYDPELKSMWNVSGELQGAKRVMLFAYVNKIKHLYLYHDYEGIAKWANQEWSAKNQEAKDYIKFCEKIQQHVMITFIWVKGHSNDKYNDLADRLAAQATFTELAKEI